MRVETGIPMNNLRAVGDVARAAEAAGYDGIVSPEIANDPFISLAFASVVTEKIRLGTGIVVAFPRSPMVVAQVAMD
ncbi:MAG: LLM class flavin-dependent oxidoreductase, partial [Myxococcota bacterium]